MSAGRPIRDALAEALRRERLGMMQPTWARMVEIGDGSVEQWRIRADHVLHLLAELGLTIAATGAVAPVRPAATGPTIWTSKVFGREARRDVRRACGGFEIATIADGEVTVEQSFTMEQASIHGGMVLVGDPAARTIAGLGSQLAAALQILWLNAATVEKTP